MDIRTDTAWSVSDKVVVRGHDLCKDLLGHVGVGEMAFLQFFGRLPDQNELVMFAALFNCLVEHGITPSAIVARMTLVGAPEAMQGAVGAGLIGLGSVFVGSMETAARALREVHLEPVELDEAGVEARAKLLIERSRADGERIGGVGHALHTPIDPRAERLFEIAEERGFYGDYCRIMRAVAQQATANSGRELPVNATGAIGAISCEMGMSADGVRGIGVAARAIGLVGHIMEERKNPMARKIKSAVETAATAHVTGNYGEAK